MLSSDTLFGKKDKNVSSSPFSGNTKNSFSSNSPSQPLTPANAPRATVQQPQQNNDTGSQLIVGPNIKLKGVEINDCDTLVVEGRVEATMDSRVIKIAEAGSFKGAAKIDIAEIHGEFSGELVVRQKLVIHATGRVTGKIQYGKLVIEEGGQLNGEVQMIGSDAPVSELKTA